MVRWPQRQPGVFGLVALISSLSADTGEIKPGQWFGFEG